MIVDDAMFVLRSVEQAMRTCLINHSGGTARESIDIVNRAICEDLMLRTGVCHVTMNIVGRLCSIVMRQLALQINALADGRVT